MKRKKLTNDDLRRIDSETNYTKRIPITPILAKSFRKGRKTIDADKVLEKMYPKMLDILPLEEFAGDFDSPNTDQCSECYCTCLPAVPDPIDLERESEALLEEALKKVK